MKKPAHLLPIMLDTPVRAGFPNPAEDAGGIGMDLNDLLIKHPISTYYLRVEGDSMAGAGITSGDIVVVDRSLEPRTNDIVVAAVDGDFTLKRLKKEGPRAWLLAENPSYSPIALHDALDVQIWGVVTFWIHKQR